MKHLNFDVQFCTGLFLKLNLFNGMQNLQVCLLFKQILIFKSCSDNIGSVVNDVGINKSPLASTETQI